MNVTVMGKDLLHYFDVCFWKVWLDYRLRSTVSIKADKLMESVSNSFSPCFMLLFIVEFVLFLNLILQCKWEN